MGQLTATRKKSDSYQEEAFPKPDGLVLDAPQLPARGKGRNRLWAGWVESFMMWRGPPSALWGIEVKLVEGLLPKILCAAFTKLCRAFCLAAVQLPCRGRSPLHSGRSSSGWNSPDQPSISSWRSRVFDGPSRQDRRCCCSRWGYWKCAHLNICSWRPLPQLLLRCAREGKWAYPSWRPPQSFWTSQHWCAGCLLCTISPTISPGVPPLLCIQTHHCWYCCVSQCGTVQQRSSSSPLLHQGLWDDGVEREVQEEQMNVWLPTLQVSEGCVDHWWDVFISGAVFPVSLLVGVHSDVDGVLDVGHSHPLIAL